jgi:hypothetical protein
MRGASLLVLAVAGLPAGALGDVYTCADAEGRMVFRDTPCQRGERTGPPDGAEAAVGKSKAGSVSPDAPLERKQVERLVARLDKAMGKRDAKAVTGLLAKDAVVEVNGAGIAKLAPMDRKTFSSYLANAFARTDYVYRAKPGRISISKSKPRATVSRPIREAVIVGDTVVVSELTERLTVERDGRRVLIRKLTKSPPAKKRTS